MVDEHGEEPVFELFASYRSAFPASYQADWGAHDAVADIARFDELGDAGVILRLYRPREGRNGAVRCKVISSVEVSLSDVLPTFEHMGARVIDQHPYKITPLARGAVWIYDFGLQCGANDLVTVRDLFHDAFLAVWRGELENDDLNQLVLKASLSGREIAMLRAVAKYLRQTGVVFSDRYMEQTLLAHAGIAAQLVQLFAARFDPDHADAAEAAAIASEIEDAVDAFDNLDEARILRSFLSVLRATLRTNYFRTDDEGRERAFLSFKLDSSTLSLLPVPRPRFETFVYARRVEGVHLRGGKVARGVALVGSARRTAPRSSD